MFYVSNKEKPYYYKAQRVKKGTTVKGDHYTFVSISHKDKQDDDKYKNATLQIWDDIDIKEGDSIAFYDVLALNYKETESGFKKYINLDISTNKVKVKTAEEKSAKKSSSTASKPTTSTQTEPAPVNNSRFEDYGAEDDLPF